MWASDASGAQVPGSVNVAGRENSIEILAMDHLVNLPLDPDTGAPVGTRRHMPFVVTKEIDASSPHLFRALCQNEIWTDILFRFYRIDDVGAETEYYSISLANVNIISIKTEMGNVKYQENERLVHQEKVAIAYQKIQWVFADGNLAFSDDWKNR
jgi:type VI secretion system secreted protein Hcp